MAASLAVTFFGGATYNGVAAKTAPIDTASAVNEVKKLDNGLIDTHIEDYFDEKVVTKLPETVAENDDISVIVKMNVGSVIDAYNEYERMESAAEFASSERAAQIRSEVALETDRLINLLNSTGINYTVGEKYDTVLSGFEITVKAKYFTEIEKALSSNATLIVGEVYAPAETKVVHNDVDVYSTGIFDSSEIEYQGDGVVVAVLDTGLDYTHTAFDVNNFTTTTEAFTLDYINEKIASTEAYKLSSGLSGEDVYMTRKVPYAYDYADKDPDVLPINSEHGTHVAGIIAGKDDVITGVAPNAQLAIMKVFSDTTEGAKTSWLLAALEDCVNLGVDVINMSLGSGCGFTRETDKDRTNEVYDSIRNAGISLIASAANSYNATMSSTKNGNNPLTSNPDSGTVGSPSTYNSALSIASVDGVKTPYIVHDGEIIYFNQASDSSAKQRDFVGDILKTVGDVDSYEFDYVTIPGIGRSSDYPEGDYTGKIVLVKRGTTTFEDKVYIALKEKGAAGIIIYNNVSGIITMTIGTSRGATCSITQEEGERLAAKGTGKILVSRANVAGPFMSDFSSWGPTSDLKIKPEITAHGGEIYSAVPGQAYDHLSGTSMAAPNLAGAAALIRQYVKYSGVFGTREEMTANPGKVTALVNQLIMSTADIIKNKNGLAYAVRKQGAGLINIKKSTTTATYVTTYEGGDESKPMDKSKLELGDDKAKTGEYPMKFSLTNVTGNAVSYELGSIVMTEGVSTIYTSHSDTTVTQEGYQLGGGITLGGVTSGSFDGNVVTVPAHSTATVNVTLKLTDEDKKYLDSSFAHGMYIEGFVTMTAKSGTSVDVSVPYLAFYGDWTEAPIFDEEYYDTNKDEVNAGIDDEDKLMEDAYATRVIGGLYSDYISTLGSYYFVQDPTITQIAADKSKIAISNQTSENAATLNNIEYIWAGLLRNAKHVDISIIEDSTGKEVFTRTEYNQRKSFNNGGSIRASSIDVDFSTLDLNLKNNTKYTAYVTAYIDYGNDEDQKNVRNTFTFPIYIDFEAPIVTGVRYYTEYDSVEKKTHLFAEVSVYDNHYAMGVSFGQIVPADPSSGYTFSMKSFGKYITPVYSTFNSTSVVTIELTDYVAQIKNSAGLNYNAGANEVVYHNNSFIASCYDYAMNSATYEIRLPDEILAMYFDVQDDDGIIEVSPNEIIDIASVLKVYPENSWLQTLDFTVSESDKDIIGVVNQSIIAKSSGTATVTAKGTDKNGNTVSATLTIKVLSEEDEGYVYYSAQYVNKFDITGYKTLKAYYAISNSDREIGVTGGEYAFGKSTSLSMFPSEKVSLIYTLDSYFKEDTDVEYKVGNSSIAEIVEEEDGTKAIRALAKGVTIVNVTVTYKGKSTVYSDMVSITVKDPFTTNSIYLMSYKGLGGEVVIPDDRGITTIYSYAFSNYEYVDKDLEAGDVIDDEDPYKIKQQYIGEDTITKVVIPEGVLDINSYAFANLSALEEVVLPTTLRRIGVGAFLNCKKLKTINLDNVKFINEKAFSGCTELSEITFKDINAIGNYSFENCSLTSLELPASSQSLGIGAFYGNKELASVTFNASKIKVGTYAFAECSKLRSININAAVISAHAFENDTKLERVTLGADVSVIGEYAFKGTNVSSFGIVGNKYFTSEENGALIYKGDELVLVAPNYKGAYDSENNKPNTVTLTHASSIATGAFSGNKNIYYVTANLVKTVGAYAFAECTSLRAVNMHSVEEIGDYAFFGTESLTETPNFNNIAEIGRYAFAASAITSVTIPSREEGKGVKVGDYAFGNCRSLISAEIGDNAVIGEGAFYCSTYLLTFERYGNNPNYPNYNLSDYYTSYNYEVKDEDGNVVKKYTYWKYNFDKGATSKLKTATIGAGVVIGDYAFAGNAKLEEVAFAEGGNVKVGNNSFFNAFGLKTIDLSKVVSIGEYAFSGTRTKDIYRYQDTDVDDDGNITRTWRYSYAYERTFIGGEERITGYKYTSVSPAFTEADLSGATSLGEGAFAVNTNLEKVTLNGEITEIPDFLFAYCSALTEINYQNIVKVGAYAFTGAAFEELDLSKVEEIGEYAFARTALKGATLKDGATIGARSFFGCELLKEVENLGNVATIGAYSFSGAAMENIELNAAYIGDYAFANSAVKTVTFGKNVTAFGENPFYNCEIETFARSEKNKFGELDYDSVVDTYDVSSTVKVMGGVLYQVVPNGGLELISYPMARADKNYSVEEGTVRITAYAFANSAIEGVTLPVSLKSLGDKAFYGCENLSFVEFRSYYAPSLEEEYDTSYLTYLNLPMSGRMTVNGETYEGLGISDYYMWNLTSHYNNFYYGANFVDHIGHIEKSIAMIKPANGQNYDTFILGQYFSVTINGSNAATDDTLKVIAMIDELPVSVSLSDEAKIVAARTAYDGIPSLEQKSLVNNYSSLTAAENTLAYLKSQQGGGNEEPDTPSEPTYSFGDFLADNWLVIVFGALFVLAAGGLVTVILLNSKKSKEKQNK